MNNPHANNPLHGITLEVIVTKLVEHFGWEELGQYIEIRCFNVNPSIKSSLVFLRKTEWARKKVEKLYLEIQPEPRPESPEQSPSESPETLNTKL